MSFGNKDNGREYMSRANSNPNKMQSINSRNINSSQQYSNSNNGESYSYDSKRGCNSPKQSGEIHNNNQQNSNIKEHYPYKNNNRYYMKYNMDRPNYYSQPSSSPTDVIIPDIDQLKEFIREQSSIFQCELAKYESRKSCSPPRSNFHQQDQIQQRSQQRTYVGQNRAVSGMSTSTSLGTIASSNSNFSTVSSFATTPMSKLDKQSIPYTKCSYNKTVQSTGKSNSETFSKAPPVNKHRVSSPNSMIEKSTGNKSQFIPSSNIGGSRQDSKSDINKPTKFSPYNLSPGINSANSQQNSNNSVTALSYAHKINQQSRPSMGSAGSNGKNVGSNSFDTHKSSTRVNGETEQIRPHKVEVRIADTPRSVLNSVNTTDSMDVDFCTSDSTTSPCSPRSSQTDDNRGGPGLRPTKKAI